MLSSPLRFIYPFFATHFVGFYSFFVPVPAYDDMSSPVATLGIGSLSWVGKKPDSSPGLLHGSQDLI
jgi:hypothetical protein